MYAGEHKLFKNGQVYYYEWRNTSIEEYGIYLASMILEKVKLIWDFNMFKNYLKTALRNIKKHKGYTFINICGLAVGMTCCILMLLWVQNELSYDRFHEHAHNLYRVVFEKRTAQGTTEDLSGPVPLGPAMKAEFPEIADFTTCMGPYTGNNLLYNGKGFMNDICYNMDPHFFEIFSFPFIKGSSKTALNEPYSIVITEKMARKYFGDEDPLGKFIYDEEAQRDYKVTGLIENIPQNSHLQFDCIYPRRAQRGENWSRYIAGYYVLLKEKTSSDELSLKIVDLVKKHHPETSIESVYLQPITNIHLYSDIEADVEGRRNITYVYLLSVTALIIFLIACINYMNLSTARFTLRAKEIGIRKVSGACRKNIIEQFFCESILLSSLALPIALILTEFALPVFNNLSGKQLTFNILKNIYIVPELFIIILITGVIAGSYPALFLSSFQPVQVIKEANIRGIRSNILLRRLLIIMQFSLTIILFIGTAVIHNQLNFIRNRNLGFDRNNIITFEPAGDFYWNYQRVKHEVLQHPDIINVTKSSFTENSNLPRHMYENPIKEITWEGKNPGNETVPYPTSVDYDFLRTFNIPLLEGRFFSKDLATDSSNVILNETAVKAMGLTSPIGKRISFKLRTLSSSEIPTHNGLIIGVVKDFHQRSLHSKIQPIILTLLDLPSDLTVKVKTENMSETISFMNKKWQESLPGFELPYKFLDETIDNFYKADERIFSIFTYFSFLAIFIACLGLFGMVSFMAERRTKEIGIRKVLGASLLGIISLQVTEFIKWILLANVIAWPAAYFAMNRWLQNFAYRVNPSVFVFMLAGFITLIIALITVSYQAVKVAHANPVESLRYE